MEVEFSWRREEPEDFIVKEVSDVEFDENGEFFIYLLIKRGISTRELAKKLDFSYAGLKDTFALTMQKVCFADFKGDYIRKELKGGRWFILKFLGKSRKKLKIGYLKGNRFSVNVEGFPIEEKDSFVNYYDTQRLSGNWKRGRELLKKVNKRKRLSWTENFLVDSYLSYLWNKSLELFLTERFTGYWMREGEEKFFIPSDLTVSELPKFWTILGYKKKLLDSERYYREVLKNEGFDLEDFLLKLKLLKIKGDYRMSYVNVRDFKAIGDRIFFSLPKGSYATMFLKHLQKVGG